MKNTFFVLAFFALAFFAFQSFDNRNLAQVDYQEGIYIFIRSKPVTPYTSLGRVNMPELVWSGKSSEKIQIALKRVKKQYKEAEALIFDSSLNNIEAIKFNK